MRRFTIMGFTEAELGFVLAALFMAVAITTLHDRDASAASAQQQSNAADSLAAELETLRDSVDLLHDSLIVLEHKMSSKVPQCWEKGEQSEPVAAVDVLGANLYRMNGDRVTINDVRARLATFIERGDSLGCRFVVRARPTPGVNALEQSEAVWRLRRWFDVNDRPR